jgi:hypothetical protein
MVFSTAEGAKTVDSNNRLLLAMSKGVGKDAPPELIISNSDNTLVYAGIGTGAAAGVGLGYIASKSSDNVRNASLPQ